MPRLPAGFQAYGTTKLQSGRLTAAITVGVSDLAFDTDCNGDIDGTFLRRSDHAGDRIKKVLDRNAFVEVLLIRHGNPL